MKWKFLPWTHEIPPWGGIPPRLGTTAVMGLSRPTILLDSRTKNFNTSQLTGIFIAPTKSSTQNIRGVTAVFLKLWCTYH